MVGLELIPAGWQFTILNERGELGEEGCARSMEALRERFALLAPTTVALGVDPRALRVASILVGLKHTVFFSGEMAGELRPALLPLVERMVRHGLHLDVPAGTLTHRDVVFRPVSGGPAAMTFLVSLDGPDDGPAAASAMYFAGPLPATGRMDQMITRTAAPCGSWLLALGLFRLWSLGELAAPKAPAAAA